MLWSSLKACATGCNFLSTESIHLIAVGGAYQGFSARSHNSQPLTARRGVELQACGEIASDAPTACLLPLSRKARRERVVVLSGVGAF